jgi:ABC-type dipeptide/oligopeptide/nickel transport system permease component
MARFMIIAEVAFESCIVSRAQTTCNAIELKPEEAAYLLAAKISRKALRKLAHRYGFDATLYIRSVQWTNAVVKADGKTYRQPPWSHRGYTVYNLTIQDLYNCK